MEITFKSAGLDDFIAQMSNFSSKTALDSVRAVNKVIASSRAGAAAEIMQQVNFTRSYLGSPNDRNARLAITKRATRGDVEATISARVRPTSLANPVFLKNSRPGDVRVAVRGNFSKPLRGAFVVRCLVARSTSMWGRGSVGET